MSAWSLSNEERNRERFWRTPPPDPTRAHKRAGVPHFAKRNSLRALMPSDFIPIGEHAGKHLHAVPQDYLLWVNAQPWSKTWPQWQPVADYISRFILDASDSDHPSAISHLPSPLFYLDPQNRLYTLPGHEDLLQTLAEAVLNQRPCDYQHGAPPHYQLTKSQVPTAQRLPHVTKTDTPTTQDHRELWIQFFRTKPKLPQ